MKRINKYISLLLATALLASCDKFDEINTDPDATTKVTSSLLATGLLLDITSYIRRIACQADGMG